MGCSSMGATLLCLLFMLLSPDSTSILTVLAQYKLSCLYHFENVLLYNCIYLKQQMRVQNSYVKHLFQF